MESTTKTPDLDSALQLLLTSSIRQTPSELAFNQLVFEEVSTLIRKTLEKIGKHEGVQIEMYGSSANGLALRGQSDIDICIKVPGEEKYNSKLMTEVLVKEVRNRKECYTPETVRFEKPMAFATTFGEIMNLVVVSQSDEAERREVGIVVSDPTTLPIRDLVLVYGEIDPRFRDLGLLLKYWNSKSFGKGVKRMLVSHAVIIMAIAYL